MQKILPATFSQRVMALIIDASILVFLTFIFSVVIIWAASSFFNLYGLFSYTLQFLVPMAFISFLYYLPETSINGRSLGKSIMGLEIRSSDNQKAGEVYLWIRYFLKQIPSFMVFSSYIFDTSLYYALTIVVLITYLFAFLAISSQSQQSWYDQISSCAIYPIKTKVFKTIQKGKNKSAIKQSKLAENPHQLQYPCMVELKLFCLDQEGLEDKIFELFNTKNAIAQESHIQSKGKKGPYHVLKALATFESAEQMDDTYQALRNAKDVVMLLPKKAFKLRTAR